MDKNVPDLLAKVIHSTIFPCLTNNDLNSNNVCFKANHILMVTLVI